MKAGKASIALGLGALLLLGWSSRRGTAPSPAPPPPAARLPGRLMLIGDSLAVGLKGPLAALAGAAGVPFEGHGTADTRVDQWAPSGGSRPPGDYLDGWLQAFRPTHVLVSLGTNDAAGTGVDPGKLDRLISKIRESGAEVLWVGPPTLPARIALGNEVRSAIRSAVARYFPSEILDIPRAGDGLHPTTVGYARWAQAVWDWILSGHTYVAL